ncbi:MAG: hypothetical protein ACK56I_06275, partial [bacterium]
MRTGCTCSRTAATFCKLFLIRRTPTVLPSTLTTHILSPLDVDMDQCAYAMYESKPLCCRSRSTLIVS